MYECRLKWKEHEDNTVDFEMRNEEGKYALYIRTQQGYKYVDNMKIDQETRKWYVVHLSLSNYIYKRVLSVGT